MLSKNACVGLIELTLLPPKYIRGISVSANSLRSNGETKLSDWTCFEVVMAEVEVARKFCAQTYLRFS